MSNSSIEWTNKTWNPTTGCNKISSGCKNCYAETMAKRLASMKNPRYVNGFNLTIHPDKIGDPLNWKNGSLIFVNSMSDLFHKDVPLEFILQVFQVMNDTPRHTYQILTKRSDRLMEIAPLLKWTTNIWMGVSIENESVVSRIDDLRKCDSKIKFLSCEPLIGPLQNLNLSDIDWVIVGGESGKNPRLMKKEWVEDILSQCNSHNIPFFFKQWGGTNKKKSGRILNGRTWDSMPLPS